MNLPEPSGLQVVAFVMIPKVRTKTHSDFYGPHLWNIRPEDLRVAENVDIFKTKVKTFLFSLAFN